MLAKRNRVTRRRKRKDQRPTFHDFAEDDEEEQASGGLNHLAQRNTRGAHWTWERDCRRARSPKQPQRRKRRDPRMGRGSKDQDDSTSRTTDSRSCLSELLKCLYARARGKLQMREKPLCRHLTPSKPEMTCSPGRMRRTSGTGRRRRNRCSERTAICLCWTCL